jgi:hypothetical protein
MSRDGVDVEEPSLVPVWTRRTGSSQSPTPPFAVDGLRVHDQTTRSGYSKGYSKALKYEYRVKTAALGTLKRYSILSLTLYLEWYSVYSIVGSGGPH